MLAHGFRNPVADRGAARHERRLGGGPGRRLLRGARPRPRPDRPRAQLRLALLRGRHGRERQPLPPHPPPQRRPGPEHLREPLCGGDGHVGAVLGLRPRAAGRARARTVRSTRSTGEPAGNQISGLAFYPAAGSFPAAYRRALFFGDQLRNCIYAMLPGPDGVPDRGQVVPFAQQAGEPVRDRVRAGRRHAVHRLGRGCGAPGVVPERLRQPGADRRRAGRRDLRERPSDGGLRRLRRRAIPDRRRRDRVRMGPRRGRRAGRLDRPPARRSPTCRAARSPSRCA